MTTIRERVAGIPRWLKILILVGLVLLILAYAVPATARLFRGSSSQHSGDSSSPRVEYRQDKVVEPMPYATQYVVGTVPPGGSPVKQAGVAGERTIIYQVKIENGQEVSRQQISNKITKTPQSEVVIQTGTSSVTSQNQLPQSGTTPMRPWTLVSMILAAATGSGLVVYQLMSAADHRSHHND